MRWKIGLWLCAKAVIGNGEKILDEFRVKKRNSVIEAANLACDKVFWPQHEWVSNFLITA